MRFSKFLPLVMVFMMNFCFGSNVEENKEFANKRVACCVVSAQSDVLEESDRYHLDKQKVKESFNKIDQLLHELVGIITFDSEDRYVSIDKQLNLVESCIETGAIIEALKNRYSGK